MDKRKIVIVGASHGGHESAIELLDKYNDVVVIYKKRTNSLVVIGIRIGSHKKLFHDEYKLRHQKNK